ncbi:MAG: hypothetical protein K2X28_03965 [Alphaproteobacteria bacterium]|nr:hypothetical protein [Alphaproteobacteria bacterium]
MLTRLLFFVAFLQVFSLQTCFAFLKEDQENKIPHTPSTPLKRPPEKSIFSPLTILENKFSPVRKELAIKKTLYGSVSPKSMERVYRDFAPEFLISGSTGMYLDPSILNLEKSLELMSLGHNPTTYDNQKTEVHHLLQTPRRKILLPKKLHRSRNRYIVTKQDLLSEEVTVVATRLTKQRGKEIIKESEAEALEKEESVKFHLIGNILHPAKGPSRINRAAFKTERQNIFKETAKKLSLL